MHFVIISFTIIKFSLVLEDMCYSIRFKPGFNRCQYKLLLIINEILYLNNTLCFQSPSYAKILFLPQFYDIEKVDICTPILK